MVTKVEKHKRYKNLTKHISKLKVNKVLASTEMLKIALAEVIYQTLHIPRHRLTFPKFSCEILLFECVRLKNGLTLKKTFI